MEKKSKFFKDEDEDENEDKDTIAEYKLLIIINSDCQKFQSHLIESRILVPNLRML
jgi:hypothetical protein